MRAAAFLAMLLVPALASAAPSSTTMEQAASSTVTSPSAPPVPPADSLAEPEDEAAPARALTPLFSFHFDEGLSLPSIGGVFIGNNIGSTVGGKYAFTEGQALFGAYELTYAGPGMRSAEGREFQERSIDHSISGGHSWALSPAFTLGSRVQYLHEFRRSGSNEAFGHGLYDFWSLGLTERADLSVVPGLPLGVFASCAYVRFPNYTDLMQALISASVSAESSGGQQDFRRYQLGVDGRFDGDKGRGWLTGSVQDFVKQRVITGAGTVSDQRQLDFVTDAGAAWKTTVTKGESAALTAEPLLRATWRVSNQNFLRFRSLTDTSPAFVERNYDYVSPSLGMPVRWTFNSGRSLFLVPSYALTIYTSRPPRDTWNNYVTDKKQLNRTFMVSAGYAARLYAYATWSFGYTLLIQRSNNHFESYLPYNYSGHYVFAAIDITY